jgi:hypothetical protein
MTVTLKTESKEQAKSASSKKCKLQIESLQTDVSLHGWLSLTLKIEVICFNETSVNFYQTTHHYITDDSTLQVRIYIVIL